MPDLKDKAKQAVNYAKNLYAQGKALVQPIDKGTAQSLAIKAGQIGQMKADQQKPAPQPQAKPSTFKRGGKVKKTGMAKVHKGERVLTRKQNRRFEAARRRGSTPGYDGHNAIGEY